jgi:hypothetical protein
MKSAHEPAAGERFATKSRLRLLKEAFSTHIWAPIV